MAEERWYYLHESRQIGPCSESELHALLAKGEISLDTSVWSRSTHGWRSLRELSEQPVVAIHQSRLKWAIPVIAVCGITAVASALLPKMGDVQNPPSGIEDYNQNAAPAVTGISSAPPMPDTSTRAALSDEMRLEMELWRSIKGLNDADLYQIYLSRYPDGTFADIATTKIRALGADTKSALADQYESATSPGSGSSKPVNRKRTVKTVRNFPTLATTGNCWNGNISGV